MKRGVAAVLVAAVSAGFATTAWVAQTSGARPVPRRIELSFQSRAIASRLHFVAYLPAGYSTSDRRFPVVYFLHGLPAPADAYRDVGWLARARAGLPTPVIFVAPQGSRREDADPEYLDWGPGRNWETALARELPAYVDSHLRTIRARSGRALVGLSAGGYGAVQLALHHLDDFAVVESWSGYFHPTNPAGTRALDLGSRVRNRRASTHAYVAELERETARHRVFFAFYVGRGDARFRAENELLHRELAAAHVPHVFAVYPGAHERSVWQAHGHRWLELARRNLARPR